MTTGHQYDLPYLVEQWDDADSHVEELIALDTTRLRYGTSCVCRIERCVSRWHNVVLVKAHLVDLVQNQR